MTKTEEQIVEDYENHKKRKTLRNWKTNYGITITLEDFNHFKENKKYYLEIKKYEEIKKSLNPKILSQII